MKTKTTKRNLEIAVVMPKNCKCSVICCRDCMYMDLEDADKYGHYYCGRKETYYPAGDSICGEYEER